MKKYCTMSFFGQMNKLIEWGVGKPVGLVIIAQQLAVSAESCFEFLKLIKAGEKIEALSSMPKGKEWVSLYRNHRKMERCLIKSLRRFGKNGKLAAEVGEAFFLERGKLKKTLGEFQKSYREMNAVERRQIMSRGQKDLNRLYALHIADIESDIKGKVDEKFNTKFKEALNNPEINFYLRVWIPCWLLYGEFPPRLLRQARLGKLSGMDKLIRLDTRVLNDTKIGDYLHKAREEGKKRTVDRITEAIRGGPKPKVTVKKVKCNIAGLISSISMIMGHKLKEPEIRSLFDAVARDTGKGDIDTDLPEGQWAFAKAIRRQRAFWIPSLRPDKK